MTARNRFRVPRWFSCGVWLPASRAEPMLTELMAVSLLTLVASTAICPSENSVNHRELRQSSHRTSEGKPESIFSIKFDPVLPKSVTQLLRLGALSTSGSVGVYIASTGAYTGGVGFQAWGKGECWQGAAPKPEPSKWAT